jgi:hypothetical protein
MEGELKLTSRFFEEDKEPKSEAERQLAHLRENLMDLKKLLTNEEEIKLVDTAMERGTAVLMQLDRI